MRQLITAFVLIVLSILNASGQQPNIYADPQNLEVLPSDISPQELSATMKSFTFALNARCSSCHVGDEDQPLTEYDFAADDKPMKNSARTMLRMMAAINDDYLKQLGDGRREGVEVRCVTCHRGQDRPRLIEDVLDRVIAEEGIEAAIARYRSLREDYFGSHAFDFSETPINEYALRLAKSDQAGIALELINLSIEYHPDSFMGYWYKARIQSAQGNIAGAIASLEAAIKLAPERTAFLQQQLDQLKLEQGSQDK